MLNSSNYEQGSDDELAQLENEELFESDTETSSDSEDECACQFNDLRICVLTKEESLIIDLIDKIEDPEKKREVLESYISVAKAGPSNPQPVITNVRQPVENYSFKTIVNRMNDENHKKEPTLNDLQCEVHNVKEELRKLKIRVRVLELYRPFLEKDTEEKSEQLEFENLMGEFQEKIEPVRREALQEEQVSTMKFFNSIDRVIAQKWVRTRNSRQMTPNKSSSALTKSSPLDPKPLMSSSPHNKGKEKQIAKNPFREYMNVSVAIIEMNDLDKTQIFGPIKG
ncbi:hypothetical protein L3X38_004221 [Prunus dulcis]|uniref:Uncharacterized protein n=1 Tax=Prunus dulcis TaxID=3755 RepID=A0AAD4ZNJ6_PRUDU|nr:hypothetical protein L3X38_004221 [Prunus dulcis]